MSETGIHCSSHPPTKADGNSFAFDPAWRTETVMLLAKAIVAESAYDRMPILADALQEAGCDDEVLLQHCRECERHEPGCWVIWPILFPAHDVTQWTPIIKWHDDETPSIYSPEFVNRFQNAGLRSLDRTLIGMRWLHFVIGFLISALTVWVIVRR